MPALLRLILVLWLAIVAAGIGLAWDSGGATLPHQAATALIPILKAGMSGASGMPKASQGPHIPQFATWQQMSGVDWREIVRVAFFARVPTPNRVNTQGQVLATNLVLALLVTLVCGVCAEVLSHTLTHEQSSLENLLWRFPPTAVLLATWHAGTDSIRASNLYKRGSGVWLGAGIFLLYGLIFSFLDRDFTRFGPGSLYLFCAMTVSVALVSLAEDAARWWLARQWRVPASIEPRGTRLGLAVLAVVISRMLGMVPGILFGSYGRLHVPAAGKFSRRQAHWLALGGVLVILGLGLGFWVVTILTDTTSAAMLFLQGITPLWATLMGLQNLYLLIFIVALQTAFFQMVPVVTAAGGEIYRWNRLLWSVLFTCITFVLVHTQLNPGKVALDSFSQGEIQVLAIGLALLLITTLSIWGYFRGRPTPQAEISKTEISKTAHE